MNDIIDIFKYLTELGIYRKNYHIGSSLKEIDLKRLKLLSIKGHECIAFNFNDLYVIKIFRNNYVHTEKPVEKNIKSLMQYHTERILMPTDIIYDENNKMCGYVMKKVQNQKSFDNILMDDFLEECYHVLEEISFLSRNLVSVNDLHYHNSIYNGNLYIIDPGLFFDYNVLPIKVMLYNGSYFDELTNKDKKYFTSIIYDSNIRNANFFFSEMIAVGTKSTKMRKDIFNRSCDINGYFNNLSSVLDTDNHLEAIEEDCNLNMTVSEYGNYVKKKIKNYR